MAEEEEAKMKKMRVRIERDAYSVLLSFKVGASANQVERRMDETLGYTYNSKYHQAGVYDMSQILREHPQVQVTADGKFKIIATKENEDLVALISKQKENKKKRSGQVQRGGFSQRGRRPNTIGHQRNSYGAFYLRNPPKASSGLRPLPSISKPLTQKPLSTVSNTNRLFTNSTLARPLNPPKPVGVNVTTYKYSGTVNAPVRTPQIQRPLVRPTTASSVSSLSMSQMSTASTSTVVAKPSKPASSMPSIKEFTDNAKLMMVKLYPQSVHLSEMTDRYSQEYKVAVDPLHLYSKSWIMLVRTTFKECFEVNDGEVSVRDDWYKKYGVAMKKSHGSRIVSSTKILVSNSKTTTLPNQSLELNSTLPTSQGFRYQIPQSKSPVEVIGQKMKGLTVRNTLPTPEKPPGININSPTKASNRTIESIFSKNQQVSKTVTRQTSVVVPSQRPLVHDRYYDSRQLKNLKFVEKSDELKCNLDAVLNGKDIPELKKITRKTSKSLVKQLKQLSPPVSIGDSQVDTKVLIKNMASAIPDTTKPSNLTTPDIERSRCRSTPRPTSSRLFGRALADIHRQSDEFSSKKTEPEESPLREPSKARNLYQKSQNSSSPKSGSDDGWNSPQFEKKVQQVVPPKRMVLLPPMSKGANSKSQIRSRPVSCSRSISSLDAITAAMNATLPDDDQW